MQGRPYVLPTWQDNPSRRRVVRSGAQYALYFVLGLAVVSLLIGLNVFLAGETAALRVEIRDLEAQRQAVEWRIAELSSRLATETNLERIGEFAEEHGFVDSPNIVYVTVRRQAAMSRATQPSPDAHSGEWLLRPADWPIWREMLDRIRSVLELARRGLQVAAFD